LNGVATRKGWEDATNELIDAGRDSAALSLFVWNEIEDGAVFNSAAVICACINGLLEVIWVPSHQEVAMASISSWVTLRPDKWLAITIPLISKLPGVPDYLEED